jgi:hypothetical protein
VYDLPQDQDDEFPLRLRQNRPQQTVGDILASVLHDTAQLAGQLDIPIHIFIQDGFRWFCVRLMQHGIDIERLSHDADIPDLFLSVTDVIMSDEFKRIGNLTFTQRLSQIRQNDRFVNLTRRPEQ